MALRRALVDTRSMAPRCPSRGRHHLRPVQTVYPLWTRRVFASTSHAYTIRVHAGRPAGRTYAHGLHDALSLGRQLQIRSPYGDATAHCPWFEGVLYPYMYMPCCGGMHIVLHCMRAPRLVLLLYTSHRSPALTERARASSLANFCGRHG